MSGHAGLRRGLFLALVVTHGACASVTNVVPDAKVSPPRAERAGSHPAHLNLQAARPPACQDRGHLDPHVHQVRRWLDQLERCRGRACAGALKLQTPIEKVRRRCVEWEALVDHPHPTTCTRLELLDGLVDDAHMRLLTPQLASERRWLDPVERYQARGRVSLHTWRALLTAPGPPAVPRQVAGRSVSAHVRAVFQRPALDLAERWRRVVREGLERWRPRRVPGARRSEARILRWCQKHALRELGVPLGTPVAAYALDPRAEPVVDERGRPVGTEQAAVVLVRPQTSEICAQLFVTEVRRGRRYGYRLHGQLRWSRCEAAKNALSGLGTR